MSWQGQWIRDADGVLRWSTPPEWHRHGWRADGRCIDDRCRERRPAPAGPATHTGLGHRISVHPDECALCRRDRARA